VSETDRSDTLAAYGRADLQVIVNVVTSLNVVLRFHALL